MSNAVTTCLLRLTWRRRWLLVEAVAVVAASALALRLVAFSRIARCLGDSDEETDESVDALDDELAREIRWAVRAIAARVPWNAACLTQALAAFGLCARRRLPVTLYLGTAKDAEGELIAHAWTRCGARVLTGAEGRRRFTVVGTFARR